MGLLLLRPMIMRAGRGRKATVRRKTRRRRSKKTEEGDKHLLWGRRRNSLTDNFTLAVYMRFLVAADSFGGFTSELVAKDKQWLRIIDKNSCENLLQQIKQEDETRNWLADLISGNS